MLQTLRNLNKVDSYNQEAFSIEDIVVILEIRLNRCQSVWIKTKEKKYRRLLVIFLTFV